MLFRRETSGDGAGLTDVEVPCLVSKMAAEKVKVVLGGQGGDEIFGGYARYLLAYFEQCIRAAIDGTYKNGNFVVTIESIVPNLGILREYKPFKPKYETRPDNQNPNENSDALPPKSESECSNQN